MIDLAIVIPFYKVKYFEQTLQSLAAQTDKRFRVYIGNDNSPDFVDDLIETFSDLLKIKYIKFDQNIGGANLAAQWMRCIDHTGNEPWLIILGDDDYLSANYVEEFYKNQAEIVAENIHVIKYKSIIVDAENKYLQSKKDTKSIQSSIEHFFDKYVHEGRSSLSEHIFRKSQYEKYKFNEMPLAWHSDDLAQLQFSEYGNIFYIKDAICYVRFSADNISGQDESKQIKQQATAYFFEYLLKDLRNFSKDNLKKFLDLLEWAEKDKGFKIKLNNKIPIFFKVYGIKALLKLIK